MQKISNAELGRKTVEEYKEASKTPMVLVLDNVRSLNNVGSAFRTADAFLLERICLCGVTGTPPNKEIEKTALGATGTVSWQHYPTTLEALTQLKAEGYTIYAVEQVQGAIQLQNLNIEADKKYAFVFGNEVYGVEQEVVQACDASIEIPQKGTKHSLNVSVSMGIVLWEACRRLF